MKNILTLFFVIFFVGCGYSPEDEGIESGMDLTDPTIAEVTAIVSPIPMSVLIPVVETISGLTDAAPTAEER